MKNLFSKAILAVAVVFTMTSCDKDDELISNDDLPMVSKSFVSQYFGSAKVISTIKDKESSSTFEYEVKLDNGVDIKFDNAGLWQDVEARNDRDALPITSFILPSIVSYVTANYATVGINSIDREVNGFDVELTNDIDLEFDKEGNFIRVDK
ncbi:PepSY-like domain-containing protein [Sphingobacterium bovistauri]|uniref:PepSY-like domain-containing protein n=1 Tax=Sphingobacterium bovistauri TaxID=2781959 RepID=A0ABS7Z5N9_9SPHI|nr:PepSY-like domain-containing protein [Sphingobacterium bovistauri]MCA5005488.1 PepSY-like domain-containing protein [Sphingobacterium bovistauri]